MAGLVTGVRPSPATEGVKRTRSPTATGENPEPAAKKEKPSPSPEEELIVESRGQKVYKLDLRGAENFTVNIN